MYRSPFHDAAPAEFIDQFDWDGWDWLYRYKETGPAYRVTDAEKDDFVAAFDRWRKWSGWTAAAFVLGLLVLLIKIDALPSTATPYWLFGWMFGAGIRHTLDLIGFRAPMLALEHRKPVSAALSKAARLQLKLDRTSPTELVGTSFAAAGFLFLLGISGWPLNWIGLLLMAGFAWMATRAIIQAVRERQATQLATPIMSPTT